MKPNKKDRRTTAEDKASRWWALREEYRYRIGRAFQGRECESLKRMMRRLEDARGGACRERMGL